MNKHKRRSPIENRTLLLSYLFGFLLVLGLFLYWQREVFFPVADDPPIRVSVLLADNNRHTTSYLREGMNQAAFDYRVDLSYVHPLRPGDADEQINLLNREQLDLPLGVVIVPVQHNQILTQLDKEPLDTKFIMVNTILNANSEVQVIGLDYEALAEDMLARIWTNQPDVKRVGLYYTDGKDSATRIVENILMDRLQEKRVDYYSYALTDYVNTEHLRELVRNREADVLIGLDDGALERLADSIYNIEDISARLYGRGVTPRNIDYVKNGTLSLLFAESNYNAGYVSIANMAARIRGDALVYPEELHYQVLDQDTVASRENEWFLFPILD